MARVTAYEATDGSLHRDRKAWHRHEANLIVAKELRPLIEKALAADSDADARQATIDNLHEFIVNGIGLSTLRDLFAVQFKPGADDGEDAGQAAGEPAAAAADAGAGAVSAPATGSDI